MQIFSSEPGFVMSQFLTTLNGSLNNRFSDKEHLKESFFFVFFELEVAFKNEYMLLSIELFYIS